MTVNERKLPEFEFSDIDGQPSFSADGKKVAFLSGRSGNFDIHFMDLDGNGLVNLTKDWIQE